MSEKQVEFQRVVSLENVKKNNIVWVDLADRLEETVFEQEYRNAVKAIERIIEQNEPAKCDKSKSKYCPYDTVNRKAYSDSDRFTEYQTAIPFIGDRGTGKTSVMCAVHRWLGAEQKNTGKSILELKNASSDIHFITLDLIDAGGLKRTDDVLELILAKMVEYLSGIPGNHDFRELYQKIDELDKSLKRVYWSSGFKDRDAGLLSLQRTVDGQKSAKMFRLLVQDFTGKVSEVSYGRKDCYLVIALDDVDLYQGNDASDDDSQFVLLEQIYNYMRGPKMIVLLTYNEHILKRKCLRHFEDIYFGKNQKPQKPTPTERRDVERLTAQFMSKLFPQEQRIYLPNFMVYDFRDHNKLAIKPGKKDGEPIFAKHYILRKIAEATGVYFDAAGTKKHFLEPRNLRELGTLLKIIDSFEEIPKRTSEETKKLVQSRNRQILLSYFYNQFALEHLGTEEDNLLQRWATLPLHRQQRDIVDMIRRRRVELSAGIQVDRFGYLDPSIKDRWKYSYGELLHNLYFATRIPKDSSTEETFFSKELIHCILGTHSVILTNIMAEASDPTDKQKVVGSSVAGRWANDMIPKAAGTKEYVHSLPIGSISRSVCDFFGWEFPDGVPDALKKVSEIEIPEKIKYRVTSIVDTGEVAGKNPKNSPHKEATELVKQIVDDSNIVELRNLVNFMEALFFLGMFFTSLPENGLQISICFKDSKGKDLPKPVLKSESREKLCYNVLNPVITSYTYAGNYFDEIEKKLVKLGNDLQSNYGQDQKKYSKNWETLLRLVKISLCQETTDLPIQSFDMMYNIVKRLASDSYYDTPEEEVDQHFKYLQELYEHVREELQKQDDVYKNEFVASLTGSAFWAMLQKGCIPDGKPENKYICDIYELMIDCAIGKRKGNQLLGEQEASRY